MKNTILLLLLIGCAVPIAAQPTVTTITPAGGLIDGGEYVHVHGMNLIGAPLVCPIVTCFPFVKFGDTYGTIVDKTSNEIVVVAPAHAAGVVDLQVNVPGMPPVTAVSGYRYQEPASSETVRLLVPVAISAAGALGTNWRTEFF